MSNPIVGINIRHVVSAMVPSNKITVDIAGGVFLSSPSLGDVLMYLYTIAVDKEFANICRATIIHQNIGHFHSPITALISVNILMKNKRRTLQNFKCCLNLD